MTDKIPTIEIDSLSINHQKPNERFTCGKSLVNINGAKLGLVLKTRFKYYPYAEEVHNLVSYDGDEKIKKEFQVIEKYQLIDQFKAEREYQSLKQRLAVEAKSKLLQKQLSNDEERGVFNIITKNEMMSAIELSDDLTLGVHYILLAGEGSRNEMSVELKHKDKFGDQLTLCVIRRFFDGMPTNFAKSDTLFNYHLEMLEREDVIDSFLPLNPVRRAINDHIDLGIHYFSKINKIGAEEAA